MPFEVVPAMGISEDVALLLAHEKGAELIVAVGTHFNLIEFLERNRAGMSSTFLTRLRVGEILVDAKGVSRLVSRRVGLWPLVALGVAGLGAIVVAVIASPGVEHLIQLMVLRVRDWLGLGWPAGAAVPGRVLRARRLRRSQPPPHGDRNRENHARGTRDRAGSVTAGGGSGAVEGHRLPRAPRSPAGRLGLPRRALPSRRLVARHRRRRSRTAAAPPPAPAGR